MRLHVLASTKASVQLHVSQHTLHRFYGILESLDFRKDTSRGPECVRALFDSFPSLGAKARGCLPTEHGLKSEAEVQQTDNRWSEICRTLPLTETGLPPGMLPRAFG